MALTVHLNYAYTGDLYSLYYSYVTHGKGK
jgi:hypothetical protein